MLARFTHIIESDHEAPAALLVNTEAHLLSHLQDFKHTKA